MYYNWDHHNYGNFMYINCSSYCNLVNLTGNLLTGPFVVCTYNKSNSYFLDRLDV